MKIIFMGTPDFAVPCLERVVQSGHDVCAVYTNPDKPKGRGYELSQSPVKQKALQYDIKVVQPKTLRAPDVQKDIANFQPDVIVVVAYGKILPKAVLDIPKYGCINVHGSLLPKYRGAAPIQWSVINGEEVTGITTMYMNEGLDTGDILLQAETPIGEDETSEELFDRLCLIGADLLVETLSKLQDGKLKSTKQNDDLATYAPMLDKSMSKIDWTKSAQDVHNLVRGLNSWPGAVTTFDGKTLKVHRTKVREGYNGKPGQICDTENAIVMCNDITVELVEVQPVGKKRMSGKDFLRGKRLDKSKDYFFE